MKVKLSQEFVAKGGISLCGYTQHILHKRMEQEFMQKIMVNVVFAFG